VLSCSGPFLYAGTMRYRFDDDCKGFHLWFDDAEFEKVRSDARSVGEHLDEYIRAMMMSGVFDAVRVMVRSGSQSNIPEMTIRRVK